MVGVVQMTSTADVDANMATRASTRRARRRRGGADAWSSYPSASRTSVPRRARSPSPSRSTRAVRFSTLPRGGARNAGADVVYGGFWEKSEADPSQGPQRVHLHACGRTRSRRSIERFTSSTSTLPDGTKLLESETVEPGERAGRRRGARSASSG